MKKTISFLMAAALILSLMPSQLVPEAHAASTENRDFITLKKNDSAIAPGVTQTIATVRKKYNSQQMVYYTLTVDTTVETAHIYANYKDNEWEPHTQGQYGLQEVTKQMDAAVKNHTDPSSDRYIENYTVVGGINGTGYNMSTGQTRNLLVMEGHEVQANITNEPFFAILKDGTPKIFWNDSKTDYEDNKDNIQEALGSFTGILIKNGTIVNSDWGSAEPNVNARTAIGVTDDGKVVMLVVDGKQAASEGCDMYELALILQQAGCVDAFNLDGGGSTTYVSRPEGESTYRVVNKPCDGAPRTVSASLMVVSTAPSSDDFNRASIAADSEYITPGGTVNLTASGISSAGTPVAIPDNVEWAIEGENGGAIDGRGASAVFTAGTAVGEYTVQMKHNGAVVGEETIHVVKPNIFSFTAESYALPFGTSIDLEVKAAYNSGDSEHTVTLHDGDVELSLDPAELGTLNGLTFTARAMDSVSTAVSGTLTAKLVCAELEDTAGVSLGRGSETLFDFETADQFEHFTASSTVYNTTMAIEPATAENGRVRSGNGSLRITIDGRNIVDDPCSAGCYQMWLNYKGDEIDLSGAVGFGAWMWVPDEEVGTQIRTYVTSGTNRVGSNEKGTDYSHSQVEGKNYDEGHWVYLYVPIDGAESENVCVKSNGMFSLLLWTNNRDPEVYKLLCNKMTFYLDDISVDYSAVHPDRDMPTIGDVKTPLSADHYGTLARGEVYNFTSNTVTFQAAVADVVNANTTGLDEKSARAYIDGTQISAVYDAATGQIITDEVKLADGVHTLKLYVSDKAGNETSATRQFRISAGSGIPTINVVPHTPDADRILINSLFYVDVAATDISKVKTVDLKLDLINNALWQLEHADVDPKFSMEFSVDQYENIAALRFTRVKDWEAGDSSTIASLPIRTWGYDWPITYISDFKTGTKTTWTPQQAWSSGYIPPIQLRVDVDHGEISYQDYTSEALNIFGGENIRVDTELYDMAKVVKPASPGKTSWHLHDAELTQVADKPATCTEDGCTGRTFCETCQSVVDWGEPLSATGHDYRVSEQGLLACSACGDTFSGEWSDGKLYKGGVVVSGWQSDGSYYDDGVKLGAGVHETLDADGERRFHGFDQDGICAAEDRENGYTGYFMSDEEGGYAVADDLPEDDAELDTAEYYYTEAGIPYTGWLYFNKDGGAEKPDDTDDPEDSDEDVGMPDDDQQQAIVDMTAYHVQDGRVHRVDTRDTRKCVVNGYMEYTCTVCGATARSEKLWWVGHDWNIREDGTRKCKVCQLEGKDIREASLNIMGENFEYTGGAIRAAVLVYHDGLSLSVRSDKNGLNGYVTYRDNIEVGKATVIIDGVGDYYGQITGTFNIVPKSVKTLTLTETKGDDAEHVTVDLSWEAAEGAAYYTVIRFDKDKDAWIEVGPKVEGTSFSETLVLGTDYYYRVASRGLGKDGDEVFYSVSWSDTVSGTVRHIWGEESERKEPTCETEGSYHHICSLCGFEETVVVPALGHVVEQWETTVQPTTSAPGSKSGTCTRCGKTVVEEIPKLPESSSGGGSGGGGSSTGTNTKPAEPPQDEPKKDSIVVKPETNVSIGTDGSASVTASVSKSQGDSLVKDAVKNDSTQVVITPEIKSAEEVSEVMVTIPVNVIDSIGKQTAADLVVSTQVAVVKIPNAGLSDLTGQKNANVTINMEKTGEGVELTIKSGDKVINTVSGGGVTVSVPVEKAGAGTVAMIVREDGSKEVIPKSVAVDGSIYVPLDGSAKVVFEDNSKVFKDVKEDNWASDAVSFASSRELFQGTGEGQFSPEKSMTRAMLVTVLYRLEQGTADGYSPVFPDISKDQWYSDAVSWAVKEGIVSGYSDGTFGGDNDISREQLAVLLYRYSGSPKVSGTLDFFDAGEASDWARDALIWAQQNKIMQGSDGKVRPKSGASRAEVAQLLMNYVNHLAVK